MDEKPRARISGLLRESVVSNLAATFWAAAFALCTAVVLLPIDTTYWPLAIAAPLLTIILIVILRRRFLIVASAGLLVTWLVNLALPYLGTSEVFFVQCPASADCLMTTEESALGVDARIYPVMDPVKWAVWRANAGDKPFRFIELNRNADGRAVLHAPIERSVVDLLDQEHDGPTIHWLLHAPVGGLIMDVGSVTYLADDQTLLQVRTPSDPSKAGVFSALGRDDDFGVLMGQVVRNDLRLRALLGVRLKDLWRSLDQQTPGNDREGLQMQLLSTALFARSYGGGVFATERIRTFVDVMPSLAVFERDHGSDDALFRAAAFHFLEVFENPKVGSGLQSQANNSSTDDERRFEEEIAVLYRMAAEMEGVSNDVAARGREMQADHEARPPQYGSIDLKQARELFPPRSIQPFSASTFSAGEARRAFESGLTDRLALERLLFAAGRQGREISIRAIFEIDGGTDDRSRLREFSERLLGIATVIREYLDSASPPVRDLVGAEVAAIERVGQQIQKMQSLTDDSPSAAIIGAHMHGVEPSRLSEVLQPNSRARALILKDRGESCANHDDRFMANFVVNWVSILRDVVPKADAERTKAKDALWKRFGENGECPFFGPGVATLHLLLSLEGDPRRAYTRQVLDETARGDPFWLREAFSRAGHPDLYEARSQKERLRAIRLLESGPAADQGDRDKVEDVSPQ